MAEETAAPPAPEPAPEAAPQPPAEKKKGKPQETLPAKVLTPEEQQAETMLALMKMDLGKLAVADRPTYLGALARGCGLNPLLKPFLLLPNQKGELTVYATAGCADQLKDLRKLTATPLYAGPFIATWRDPEGRFQIDFENKLKMLDASQFMVVMEVEEKFADGRIRKSYDVGVTSIGVGSDAALGEGKQNIIMKTHTKAERRAILGHCGVGFPDVSEVGSIPQLTFDDRREGPKVVQPQAERTLPAAPKAPAAPPVVVTPAPATNGPQPSKAGPQAPAPPAAPKPPAPRAVPAPPVAPKR